jgi:hypothetical protein
VQAKPLAVDGPLLSPTVFCTRTQAAKGDVKVCKRPLVNDAFRAFFTEFFPDPDAQGRDTLYIVDYSITSSARNNIDVGIITPIALAVWRFTASSNVVGCSTGNSAGLAPRRILSTYAADRWKLAGMLGP